MSNREHMVVVHQASGKYGRFECPLCGREAYYKFTAAIGGCGHCGKVFKLTSGMDIPLDADKGKFGPHLMLLESE